MTRPIGLQMVSTNYLPILQCSAKLEQTLITLDQGLGLFMCNNYLITEFSSF